MFVQDTDETACIMRKLDDGTVIALFPELPGTLDPRSCSSYMHVGQHGSCDLYSTVGGSRAAQPEEYAALQAELEGAPYGYRLKLYKNTRGRRTRWETRRLANCVA